MNIPKQPEKLVFSESNLGTSASEKLQFFKLFGYGLLSKFKTGIKQFFLNVSSVLIFKAPDRVCQKINTINMSKNLSVSNSHEFRKNSIIGIGCDVIEIDRIRQAMTRQGHRFLESILTPKEIFLSSHLRDKAYFVAGRFSVKEALSKALGCGIGKNFSWQSASILNDEKGKPYVVWEKDLTIIDVDTAITHISISHSKTIAMASVIIEKA